MIMTRRDVFQAISDPTRRHMLRLVASQPKSVNSIAEEFEISRPAISKHLKILWECGLIEMKKVGRESICKAQLDQLDAVHEWLDEMKLFWDNKLDTLENYLKLKTSSH